MNHALKEWAVAIDALADGKTILLLRKGGIREQGGNFTIEYPQVWLYPTYEHQQPDLLKSPYSTQVQPVPSGWHPETIPIKAWADITHVFQVSDGIVLDALTPFHIWTDQLATERFHWKPKQPLYVLLLRVYTLDLVETIPYRPEYGQCKSWLELGEEWETIVTEKQWADALPTSTPALSDQEYTSQVEAIQKAINGQQMGQAF